MKVPVYVALRAVYSISPHFPREKVLIEMAGNKNLPRLREEHEMIQLKTVI